MPARVVANINLITPQVHIATQPPLAFSMIHSAADNLISKVNALNYNASAAEASIHSPFALFCCLTPQLLEFGFTKLIAQ